MATAANERTDGEAINAVQTVIRYDPAAVRIEDILTAESFCHRDLFLERSIDNSAGEAVIACGRAYIRFGLDHPETYRIMFMGHWDLTPEHYRDEVMAAYAERDAWELPDGTEVQVRRRRSADLVRGRAVWLEMPAACCAVLAAD